MNSETGVNDGEYGGRHLSLNIQELEAGRLPVPDKPGIHSNSFPGGGEVEKNLNFTLM